MSPIFRGSKVMKQTSSVASSLPGLLQLPSGVCRSVSSVTKKMLDWIEIMSLTWPLLQTILGWSCSMFRIAGTWVLVSCVLFLDVLAKSYLAFLFLNVTSGLHLILTLLKRKTYHFLTWLEVLKRFFVSTERILRSFTWLVSCVLPGLSVFLSLLLDLFFFFWRLNQIVNMMSFAISLIGL